MLTPELRQRWQRTDDTWHLELPAGWMQGRAVFGGLTVAAGAALGIRQTAPQRTLRTLTAHLIRPVSPGSVTGRYRMQREGKSTTFAEVSLSQAGAEVLQLNLLFAHPRAAAMRVSPSVRFEGPDPETLTELPYIEGAMPECTQHMDLRWFRGGFPFTGVQDPHLAGWCRLRVPYANVEGMLGLLDAWPSPTLAMLQEPRPSSTVNWTVHFLHVPQDFTQWFGFTYDTVAAHSGFHTVVGHLFDATGRLLAYSQQLVAVFD